VVSFSSLSFDYIGSKGNHFSWQGVIDVDAYTKAGGRVVPEEGENWLAGSPQIWLSVGAFD